MARVAVSAGGTAAEGTQGKDVGMLTGLEAYLAISDLERASSEQEHAKPMHALSLGWARAGALVLDAGAGQGWHAFSLVARHEVIGVERSAWLVAVARARSLALPAGIRPSFRRSTLERLDFPEGTIDLAYSLNTSIGYDDAEADGVGLTNLARALRAGAALVLETLSASAAEAAGETMRALDGAVLAVKPRFDPATSVLAEEQLLVLEDGSQAGFRYRVRAYDPGELAEIAREAGFRRVQIFGSLAGDRWRPACPTVLVARTPPSPVFHLDIPSFPADLRLGSPPSVKLASRQRASDPVAV
jgi:ubiquinone/menaquinone biosynthesis C-methylase UbiE